MQQKFYLAFLLAIGMAMQLSAQFVPQGFNYQGIVRDDNGAPLANQTVSLLFAVRSGAPNGPVAYSEKQVLSTNEYGLVNLVVGQGGTPIQGTFAGINWGSGAKYLSIALETTPNIFDDLGTTQLMSVPYALYALSAANGGNDNWGTQVVQASPEFSGNGTATTPLRIAQQGAANGQVLKWNGVAWVPQDDNGGAGTVTEINTGQGLTGGPINTAGTISLSNTGVMPGTYGSAGQIPVITVDEQGRVTTITTINVQGGGGSITLIGGTGIDIQQNGDQYTVTNTGDTDPTNDVTTTSQSGGDVNGPFSNLQLNPGVVGTPELENGAVTSDKIANDAVNADKIAQDAVGASEIAAGAVNTVEIADGAVDGAKINDMGAQIGQVLKWNGVVWQPQADNTGGGGGSTNLTAGPGISVTGASPNFTITNTGDINAADDLTTTSQSGGDVTGPFANLQLKPDVVSSVELTDNAVETTNINNGAVTGLKINAMGAGAGQVLKFNGATWAPAQDQTGTANIVAGVAIDVIDNGNGNYVISNAGDIDPFNDITVNTPAGGDLNGFFNNLQINPLAVTSVELASNAVTTDKIAGGAVTGAKLNQMSANPGQVLKWNGTTWAPAQDQAGVGDNWGAQVVVTNASLSGNGATTPLGIAQQGAQTGQVLKWNGTAWLPDNDLNTGGDNWGSQNAVTNATLTGNGTAGNPLGIATQGATNGQVLKFNGTTWAPAADGGDNWGTQSAATSLNLGGNGTAGDPLRISDMGAAAGQVLKWNPGLNLWMPEDDDNDGPDNWGTQTAATNPTIAGNGTVGDPLRIAPQGAVTGQVLKFNGTTWLPAADDNDGPDNWGTQAAATSLNIGGDGTAGDPLRISDMGAASGQVLKWNPGLNLWLPADDDNAGPDNWGAQTAATNATIDGDGTVGDPLRIAPQGAATGQVLKFNGTTWLPADDNIGVGPADNWGTQVAVTNSTITGDGTAGNPLGIAQQGASNGQVLKWNGSNWIPANDDNSGGNSYAAGFGINITGSAPNFTIVNAGDNDNSATNEIQTLGLAGNNLSLSNGGGMVTLPPSNAYAAGAGINVTGSAPNFTIVNTGDLSATNEIQTLSLLGNDLSLSNGGGTVTLPPGNTYTAGTGINITGAAPNFTIENTGDADASPTNELQNLTLTGTELSISNGNSVDLAGLAGGGYWLPSGDDIYNSNVGNVLVGTPAGANGKLQVNATAGPAAYLNAAGGPSLVTDNGFVGLNTLSPAVQLHVKGESEIIRAEGPKAAITLSNSGAGFDGYFRITDTLVSVGTTTGVYDVALLPNGKPSLFANAATGNVGVGAPNNGTATLRVKQTGGGFQMENVTGTHNWEFLVDDGIGNLLLFNDQSGGFPAGTFAPNGFYTPSDRRLKHDIRSIGSVMDKLMKLEPVQFRLNYHKNGDPVIGFLAQDVYTLFPELVGSFQARDGETYQAVNYTGFGVVAVKALQEQQAEIEALKQENKALQDALLKIEQRLSKLEAGNK